MTREKLFDMDETKKCEALLVIDEIDEEEQENGKKYAAIVLYKTLDGVFFEDGVMYKGEPVFSDKITVYSINLYTPIVDTRNISNYDEILQAYRKGGHIPIRLKEIDNINEQRISLEDCSYDELAQEIELHRDVDSLISSLSFDTNRNLFTAICENVKGGFLYWGMGVPKEVAMVCSEIANHYIENVEEA